MSDFCPLTYRIEVQSAWTPDGSNGWTVGAGLVRSITSYYEPDDGAWLRIELTDGREIRTAARHYDVTLKARLDEEVGRE